MFKNFSFSWSNRSSECDDLGRLARGARMVEPERLSPATRVDCSRRSFAALFTPTLRTVTAAGLPIVAAVLLASAVGRSWVDPQGSAHGSGAQVSVAKVGSEVRFTIANGSRRHFVYRSEVPHRFEGQGHRVRQGSYTERLDDEAALVFYRID
jgi:hypothetical protein